METQNQSSTCQPHDICMTCVKSNRRYGTLNFHSSLDKKQVLYKKPEEGCKCIHTEEEQNYSDDDTYDSCSSISDDDGESLFVVNLPVGYSCESCFKNFPTRTKLHIHMANIHVREKIQGKEWDFYSLVGNSIIGNIDYYSSPQHHYYEDKMDKLTDLIDALQVNVARMKQLTTIYE